MKTKEIDPQYYETTDFSEYMKKDIKKRTVVLNKRITINISTDLFDKAVMLDHVVGTGYQNVLKTAMGIGINKLAQDLLSKKTNEKPKSKI